MAEAPPPPLQIAAAPNLPLFCLRTCKSVTITLEPEFPSGCPSATAPPFTSTFSGLRPKIFMLANPTTENA